MLRAVLLPCKRLKNLSEEIGGDINVIEVDESPEQLISLVSEGEIPFTVCDNIIAKVNSKYYPDVDISTAVGLQQDLAWAVQQRINFPACRN